MEEEEVKKGTVNEGKKESVGYGGAARQAESENEWREMAGNCRKIKKGGGREE